MKLTSLDKKIGGRRSLAIKVVIKRGDYKYCSCERKKNIYILFIDTFTMYGFDFEDKKFGNFFCVKYTTEQNKRNGCTTEFPKDGHQKILHR